MADNRFALILERFTLLDKILKKSAILCFAILGLGVSIWSRYDDTADRIASSDLTTSDFGMTIAGKTVEAISDTQQIQAQASFFRHAYDPDRSLPAEALNALVGQSAVFEVERTFRSPGENLFINMLPSVAKE